MRGRKSVFGPEVDLDKRYPRSRRFFSQFLIDLIDGSRQAYR
jgi:hypothetical protein